MARIRQQEGSIDDEDRTPSFGQNPQIDSDGPIYEIPDGTDPLGERGREGERPRERPIELPPPTVGGGEPYNDNAHNQINLPEEHSNGGDANGGAAPPMPTTSRPRTPTPTGGVSPGGPPPQGGPVPFFPLSDPSHGLAGAGGLFGGLGGLKGGGLGVPMDPTTNAASGGDVISDLLKKILGGGGVGGGGGY